MTALRILLKLALFVAFTAAFLTLYEFGPADFYDNLRFNLTSLASMPFGRSNP